MWWSTTFNKKADSAAAQEYHYDLDGLKWLKFFIYLTDVDYDTGPHVYIPQTHKPFKKKYKHMLRGYQRISDEEIMQNYNKVEKIIGNSGTMIIGDTNCFHKGQVPKKNNRLIFEFQYSNSLFGPAINYKSYKDV